ncbi:MAG: DNA topoisomerase IV subunit A [bacterium]|nr:DNA topoisomerase IV subunit A [bacterium]
MKKKTQTQEILEKIYDYAFEDIIGERFGGYCKYIIQDRAIPDVRDGLKPVQRRILFGMYKEKNTFDKPYRKSAKTVGNVMGNYHPHGDSSIYEAMVRMSQWWKQNTPYIDMHGNNGSMDGDSPAAMRYTEARLSKISNEMLKDLDYDTVNMAPNFDDTELEPTVLPAKFPNLLVNGATGISAGYATNIPPHNLAEVCDATIKRIDSPNCRLETIMDIVKGPDFPTGGIVEGIDGIRNAYTNGRGRVIVKAKTKFVDEKGKLSLIITELPFEVNKALLVRKIDEIRIDKKIDGMIEVRDESDRDGLRIVIDLKKECNKENVLNYLLKNTDLQISFNFNIIAIVNRRPKQLGIIELLDAYIEHQKECIVRRTNFHLAHAKERLHIVEGLIKCISILDEVIKVIRASSNKSNARENLMLKFGFTEVQAEAIITLQLYRLTNTDVTLLIEELERLKLTILGLERILDDEEELKNVMKKELKKIKNEYSTPRKTDIIEQISELKVDTTVMIPKEDVIVMCTKDGYVKRTSMRSYSSSNEELNLKDNDYLLGLYELNTQDVLLMFTNLGNYLYVPIYEIPSLPWKDMGKHISNVIKLNTDEKIIASIPVTNFDENITITLATKNGMIKRTLLKDFKTLRYTKPVNCMKLKDNDEMINAVLTRYNDIFIGTNRGYGLWFDSSDIPTVGLRTSGVKSINLKDDYVVGISNFNRERDEFVLIITDKGNAKRVKVSEFEKTSRGKRGLLMLKEIKSNPHKLVSSFVVSSKDYVGIKQSEITYLKSTEFSIMDRYSTGSSIIKGNIREAFIKANLEDKKRINEKVELKKEIVSTKPSLKEIDDRLMTIDDFIDIDV